LIWEIQAKIATCTNLPLNDGDTNNYTGTWGTVSATASAPDWQYYYGYGYAEWEPTTTPHYFGYGYGYGYQTGTASITYDVSWTPPAGWDGGYEIEATITADSTTFTQTGTFYISPPDGGGGGGGGGRGGGGGAPPPREGITYVAGAVFSNGKFTRDVYADSEDRKVRLTIKQGTIGLKSNDLPLTEISILEMEEPPAPPPEGSIGLIYDIGPEGATFNPPITVTIFYDPDDLAEGVDQEEMVITYYDKDVRNDETGEWGVWIILEDSRVNTETHTVTASLSHFTPFTILLQEPAAAEEGEEEEGERPTPTPQPPTPATFSVSNLTIHPTEVEVDEAVTVSVFVTNTGGTRGSYTVILKINGQKDVEQIVNVPAGSTKRVTFSISRERAGTYRITIDDWSGSFSVTAPTAPPTEEEEVPLEIPDGEPMAWWAWLIITVTVLAIAGAIFWLVMRRRGTFAWSLPWTLPWDRKH